MKRYLFALSLAAAAAAFACVSLDGNTSQSFLVVAPVLDSTFVGDTLPPRNVYLDDGSGVHRPPGHIKWSISPLSVASIDTATGKIAALGKGTALVVAEVSGAQSGALVTVSRPLDVTLLMDTVFMMPPDSSLFLPEFLAIKQKVAGPTTLWFDPSPTPSVYTVDSATGRVTAHASGGPVRYVARLTNGTDTIADTGGVVVMTPTDTNASGKFFMTATGTAIRHRSGVAIALNYAKLNFKRAFQLADSVYPQPPPPNGAIYEKTLITLRDSVTGVGTFDIDSISPQEASSQISQFDPFCNPKRPWAFWASILPTPLIVAYSHGTGADSVAGHLIIAQYLPAPVGGGAIISGRYVFKAQRTDLYTDPLGAETIRGTFVAPLRQRDDVCLR